MLVLSRQRDETIVIGDDIEITVVDIRGDKVRLGINAPKQISVHRKEVYDAIKREHREGAQGKADSHPVGEVAQPPAAPAQVKADGQPAVGAAKPPADPAQVKAEGQPAVEAAKPPGDPGQAK